MKYKVYILVILFLVCTGAALSQSWEELINQSDKYLYEKNFDKALAAAEQALNIGVKESTAKHAVSLGKLGNIYFRMGNYQKAYELYITEKNLKKSTLGAVHPAYSVSLNNLAVVSQYLGKYIEAEQYLLEALDYKKKVLGVSDSSYSKTLNNLGKLFHTTGRLSDAERYYNEALKVKKESLGEKNPSYAGTLLNNGLLKRALGNVASAENYIRTAYNIFKNSYGSNHPLTLTAGLQLAMLNLSLNKKAEAEQFFDANRKAVDELNEFDPDYLTTFYDLAMYYWSNHAYQDAERILLKIKPVIENRLGKTHTLYASCLNALGILNWMLGNNDKAYKYLQSVIVLREEFFGENHPDLASSIFNFAGLLADMKQYEQAEKYFRDGIQKSLMQITDYFPYLSENEKAKFYYSIKERFEMFNNFVLTRYRENPSLIGDMYNFHIATKALLLNNSMKIRQKLENSANKDLTEKYRQWKTLKDELLNLYKFTKSELKLYGRNIDSIENACEKLEKEISSESKAFVSLSQSEQVTWQKIQNTLSENEAAIEIIHFNLFDKGKKNIAIYVALIIKPDSKNNPEMVIIDKYNELENLFIKNYSNSISFKTDDADSYKAFWSKIDDKIRNIKKVYLSVDGIFNKINVSSLQTPSGDYLLDKLDIVLLSNTKELTESPNNDFPKEAFLIGNPKFNIDAPQSTGTESIANIQLPSVLPEELHKFKIMSLPGSEEEMKALKELFTQNNYKVNSYTGDNANKKNFGKARDVKYLVVSTHGYFLSDVNKSEGAIFGLDIDKSYDDPFLRTGLMLTGSENALNSPDFNKSRADNGILLGYEIAKSDLGSIGLAVLSACETGLGDIKNGEGVYGLQRAFRLAGANSILMSLWKVNDEATKALITEFLRNCLNNIPPPEALKKAQLKLREKYKHPYFWGGFVLLGR
ncbi:MAG: hypothetical protein HW421_2619 [Ignavibacteria bacterium]|nr:hypothetical protein [Ignavibacteria bacterium]